MKLFYDTYQLYIGEIGKVYKKNNRQIFVKPRKKYLIFLKNGNIGIDVVSNKEYVIWDSVPSLERINYLDYNVILQYFQISKVVDKDKEKVSNEEINFLVEKIKFLINRSKKDSDYILILFMEIKDEISKLNIKDADILLNSLDRLKNCYLMELSKLRKDTSNKTFLGELELIIRIRYVSILEEIKKQITENNYFDINRLLR